METSIRAPFTNVKANSNTNSFCNFMLQHDLFSVGTIFRQSCHRMATFCGPKRPKCIKWVGESQRSGLLNSSEGARTPSSQELLYGETQAFSIGHKLLFCTVALAEPMFKPPRRTPRRCFKYLSIIIHRNKFGHTFTRVLEDTRAAG